MIADLDSYRSVNVLVKHHSDDALIEAAMMADTTLETKNGGKPNGQ